MKLLLLQVLAQLATSQAKERVYSVRSRVVPDHARVKHRKTQIITHSDDSDPKILDPFLLDLFETPGELSEAAVGVVRAAMNKFLMKELQAVYDNGNNDIDTVSTAILYSNELSANTQGRYLEEMGTAVEMQVSVQFDREPSPRAEDVDSVVETVMSDLTFFIANITHFQHPELLNVHSAQRRAYPTMRPSAAPTPSPQPVVPVNEAPTPEVNNVRGSVDTDNGQLSTIVPSILAGAAVVSLAAFFLLRRRKKTTDCSENDGEYVDELHDNYSIDQSLDSSAVIHLPGSHTYNTDNASSSGLSEQSSSSSIMSENRVSPAHTLGGFDAPISLGSTSIITQRISNGATSPYVNTSHQQNGKVSFGATEDDVDGRSPRSTYSTTEFGLDANSDVSSGLYGNAIQIPSNSAIGGSKDWHGGGDDDVSNDGSTSEAAKDEVAEISDPQMPVMQNTDAGYSSFMCGVAQANTSSPASQDQTGTPTGIVRDNNESQEENAVQDINLGSAAKVSQNLSPSHSLSNGQPGLEDGEDDSTSRQNQSTSELNQTTMVDSPTRDSGTPSSAAKMSAMATALIGGLIHRQNEEKNDAADDSTDLEAFGAGRIVSVSPMGENVKGGLKGGHTAPLPLFQRMAIGNLPCFSPEPNIDDFLDTTFTDTEQSVDGTDIDTRDDQYKPRNHGANNRESSLAIVGAGSDQVSCSGRRHAGNKAGNDGSAMYQENTMHPLDWSLKSESDSSTSGSNFHDALQTPTMPTESYHIPRNMDDEGSVAAASRSSMSINDSSTGSSERTVKSSDSATEGGNTSKQLINDLVWLEKKIADVRQSSTQSADGEEYEAAALESADSLSYVSGDAALSPSSSISVTNDGAYTVTSSVQDSRMSSIVCRDCYAPPGKLHIVIHSTKDGPAIHTVKEGSSLEGHAYSGDLIIAVDNVDTRSFSAEQVMKMMAAKSGATRKITVLHFEDD